MKQDPITDPPAIVYEQQDIGDVIAADRLKTLMAEARAFGRKTVEQAVECGRALLAAKDEMEQQNTSVKKRKEKMVWTDLLQEYGFSKETARRLMTKARTHNSRPKMGHELDEVYDDGHDPEDVTGKKACRDCRVTGKSYSSKCRKCKALNRPVPEPKEEKPLVDEDGTPVPENLQPAWLDALTIRAFNKQLLDFGKAIYGLTERPGCQGVPADHFSTKLKALCLSLWAFRPGFVCPECKGQGCETCGNRGWKPVAVVRGERAAAKAKEWQDKKARSKDPLPE